MSNYLWVGLGGFIGAMARFGVSNALIARLNSSFPWGTFAVNVSGSVLLGFLATLGTETGALPPSMKHAVLVGFIGSYTTFSTWSFETLALIETGAYVSAVINVVGSIAAGFAGAAAGIALARLVH